MFSDAELVQKWIESLHTLSDRTLRQYKFEAGRFSTWLQGKSQQLVTCSADDLTAYFGALQCPINDGEDFFSVQRRKSLTESSLRQSQRIIGLLLSWATREKHILYNPFWMTPPHSRNTRKACARPASSLHADSAVLYAVTTEVNFDEPEKSLRARVITHLAFWSGATSSEISGLKLRDIKREGVNTFLLLPYENCTKSQIVTLPEATCQIIDAYITARSKRGGNTKENSPLIASLHGEKGVSAWSIWNAIRSWNLLEASPPIASPQQLRRAFQEVAVRGGIQEREVAMHLRRKSLSYRSVSLNQVNAKRLQRIVRKALKAAVVDS